jgi:dolichol-phosphate mannosyltransferase
MNGQLRNGLLGIVIPCYNEAEVLPSLLDELRRVAAVVEEDVRVLFVDDGSKDRTWQLLVSACEEDRRFACMRFSRNFGHQTAVTAGLKHCPGDAVVVMDADLQDPPDLIPALIGKWKEGNEVVYAVRENRKENWLLCLCFSGYYRLLKKLAEVEMPLDAGDFSLMDRRVVDQINAMPEHNRFVRGLRGWIGFRQTGLAYDRPARAAGKTKYSLLKRLRGGMDGVLSFSSVPMRLSIWLGLGTAALGFLYLLYALWGKLVLGHNPPGWTSLVVILLVLGGVQLFVLGIVGEYLGRIFDEVKHRPLFIVDKFHGWIEQDRHQYASHHQADVAAA